MRHFCWLALTLGSPAMLGSVAACNRPVDVEFQVPQLPQPTSGPQAAGPAEATTPQPSQPSTPVPRDASGSVDATVRQVSRTPAPRVPTGDELVIVAQTERDNVLHVMIRGPREPEGSPPGGAAAATAPQPGSPQPGAIGADAGSVAPQAARADADASSTAAAAPPAATAPDAQSAAEEAEEEAPEEEPAEPPPPPEPVIVPVPIFYFWPIFIQTQFDAFKARPVQSSSATFGFPIGPFGPAPAPAAPPRPRPGVAR